MTWTSAPDSREASSFGHPGDAELGVAAGDDRRRDDVDAAGQDRDVETLGPCKKPWSFAAK